MQSHSSFQQNFQDIRNSTLYKTPEEIVSLAGVKQGDKPSKHSTRNAQAANLDTVNKSNDQISTKFLINSRVENLNKRSYISFLIDGLVKDLRSL